MLWLFADLSIKTLDKFHAPYPLMNPLLGYLGRQTGLLYNLRFFGNIKPPEILPELLEGGKPSDKMIPATPTHNWYYREYEPQDAMSALIKFLFRCHNGTFLTFANHNGFLTKHLRDPHDFMPFLGYAAQCRSLSITESDIKGLKAIRKTGKSALEFQGSGVILGQAQTVWPALSQPLQKEILSSKNSIGTGVDKKYCYNSFVELLQLIAFAVLEEKKKDSPYPEGTVEQVLLTFLWCHSWMLPPDVPLPASGELSTIDQYIVNQYNAYFAAAAEDSRLTQAIKIVQNLASLGSTPYGFAPQPCENGTSKKVQRKPDGTTTIQEETFPDCVETSFRHFLSIIFYNKNESRGAQFDKIPRIDLRQFFNSLDNVNFGDVEKRSQFYSFIGDLNKTPDPFNIVYVRPDGNELVPGFINFLNVFTKIFKDQTGMIKIRDDLSKLHKQIQGATAEKYNEEIAKLFDRSLKAVGITNITVDAKTTIQNQHSLSTKDAFGDLTFTATYEGKTVTYVLNHTQSHGRLTQIEDNTIDSKMLDAQKKSALVLVAKFKAERNTLQTFNIYSTSLQVEKNKDNKAYEQALLTYKTGHISAPLYIFYPNSPTYDSFSVVSSFNTACDSNCVLFNGQVLFKQGIDNVFSWLLFQNDLQIIQSVGDKVASVMTKNCFIKEIPRILKASSPISESIKDKIKFLIFDCGVTNDSDAKIDLILKDMPLLQSISIGRCRKLYIQNLPNLRYISGYSFDNGYIDLRKSPRFEDIFFDHSRIPPTFILGSHPKLKKIGIGLKVLELNLSQMPELEEILILSNANVGKVTLGHNPKLKSLNATTDNIGSLDTDSFDPPLNIMIHGEGPLAKAARTKLADKKTGQLKHPQVAAEIDWREQFLNKILKMPAYDALTKISNVNAIVSAQTLSVQKALYWVQKTGGGRMLFWKIDEGFKTKFPGYVTVNIPEHGDVALGWVDDTVDSWILTNTESQAMWHNVTHNDIEIIPSDAAIPGQLKATNNRTYTIQKSPYSTPQWQEKNEP